MARTRTMADVRRVSGARVLRMTAPVTALRTALGDAAIPAVWTREGVRLSAAGTVAAIDDARCATTTGRLVIPRNTINYMSLGNLATTFDGLTKLTVLVRVQPQVLGQHQTLLARFGAANDNTSPFLFRIDSASNKLLLGAWDGAATQFSLHSTAIAAPGLDTWMALVYDGTQAGANRARLGMTPPGTAMATVVGSSALLPAALPASVGVRNVTVGASDTGASPATGPMDTIALYIGSALTDGQINAEIAANCSGAHHRYVFDGDLTDSGVTGGWNGTAVGTGLTYCSDDVRWGPLLLGGGAGANPTWDAANREVVFDGAAQYLRAVGGTLPAVTGDCGMAMVGTLATAGAGTSRIMAILSDSLTAAGNMVLDIEANATNHAVVSANSGNVADAGLVSAFPNTRAVFARRRRPAADVLDGIQLGSGAEATNTIVGGANFTAQVLTVGGSRAFPPGNFAAIRWRGQFVYAGDFAGKQPLAFNWAQSLGATL